jgi:hypothetical protein
MGKKDRRLQQLREALVIFNKTDFIIFFPTLDQRNRFLWLQAET